MRTRRFVALAALVCVTAVAGLLPGAALAGPGNKDQNTASESYFRLDVPNGTVSARVEATVQNAGSRDSSRAVLWAMPRAENIVVRRDEEVLATKISPALGNDELPTVVEVTLPRTLKPKAQMDIVMTYDVPSQTSEYVRLEKGATEALFVSQGPGSFVLLDLPSAADNVLDPGCLKATGQPGDVKDAGLERWVCGEVTLIALSPDDKDLLAMCADMDDRCRQRIDRSPYSAFVQSISDPSLQGILSQEVQLGRGPVIVDLKYFKRDKAWADKQFAMAIRVMPLLESLYGFNYPHERIVMRQSHHIESIGAAGVAFSNIGEVLLATDTGIDEEVTIHELAHQWAGYQMETSWLWEGLAEYATQTLARDLGVDTRDWGWQATGYTDPIGLWWNGSSVRNPYYWYGKSAAFWFAYRDAVGGSENMTRVLSLVDDYEADWPLDGEWFVDRGEEISGANLDELFLTWVYNRDTAGPLFKSRREAQTLVAAVRTRSAEFGFVGLPIDLQENLDQWTFNGVPAQVNQANALMDEYTRLAGEVEAAGLPQLDNVKRAWNTERMKDIAEVIADQRQALDAIVNSTRVLANESPDAPSLKQLAEARQKWAEGDLDTATRLGAQAATTSFNEDASIKMIALALEKQASFKPSFLGRIGVMWKDPDGQLRAAEEAANAGDPNKALELSQSAFRTWDNADREGIMRLSILMGVMCLLSFGVWWLLRRLDDGQPKLKFQADPYAATGGHSIGDPEGRKPSWRDWENTP